MESHAHLLDNVDVRVRSLSGKVVSLSFVVGKVHPKVLEELLESRQVPGTIKDGRHLDQADQSLPGYGLRGLSIWDSDARKSNNPLGKAIIAVCRCPGGGSMVPRQGTHPNHAPLPDKVEAFERGFDGKHLTGHCFQPTSRYSCKVSGCRQHGPGPVGHFKTSNPHSHHQNPLRRCPS